MNSLEAHRIQKAGAIADDQTTVEVVLRLRPVTALRNRLGAVSVEYPASQKIANKRMRLEQLEAMMWINSWVRVVETDHKTNRDASAFHVVDESTAEFFVSQRPTHRVEDPARCVFLPGYIPNFFHADGVD